MLLGVDVWSGYGRVDWPRAKAAGVRFAFVKCTQGNSGKDPRYDESAKGLVDAGVPFGAYLYAYPLPYGQGKPAGRSPEDQARRLFADCCGHGRTAGELPPVLDFEFPTMFDPRKVDSAGHLIDQWKRWGVTAESIADWGLACLAEMERLWGRVPILYTYPDFWRQLGPFGKRPAWARYPLWIATYPARSSRSWLPAPGDKPIVPAPWADWALWQFSADGSPISVPGVPATPLDRDVVKDEDTLQRLLMTAPARPAGDGVLGRAAVTEVPRP